MLVPVIRYPLFICALLFIIDRSFIVFIVRLFCCFHSHRFFVYLLFKREKNNSDPELCSGYFNPATHSSSSIQVNKHHTADSTDFVLV
jgi:hypothetical protein